MEHALRVGREEEQPCIGEHDALGRALDRPELMQEIFVRPEDIRNAGPRLANLRQERTIHCGWVVWRSKSALQALDTLVAAQLLPVPLCQRKVLRSSALPCSGHRLGRLADSVAGMRDEHQE